MSGCLAPGGSTRIVAQIRARWPAVEIILRADSGLCREELMSWCEHNAVDYVFVPPRTYAWCARSAPSYTSPRHSRAVQFPDARSFKELVGRRGELSSSTN